MVRRPEKASPVRIILVSGSLDGSVHGVVREIRRLRPKYGLVQILTTRPPSADDPPGLYRCDVPLGEFAQREANGQFFWSETRDGTRYGVTAPAMRDVVSRPVPSIAVVEPENAQVFKRHFTPEQMRPFFLLPPRGDDLVALLSRTASDERAIERAVQRAVKKSSKASYCGVPYNFINFDAAAVMARQALEQLR
jgi:guanylate kinase